MAEVNWYEEALKVVSRKSAIHLNSSGSFRSSLECVEMVIRWEGFEEKAYKDIGGVITIGFGETKGVKEGDTITHEAAKEKLEKRLDGFWDDIKDSIRVPITQAMCDALTSFTYNVGVGAFKGSTLLRRLNSGDYEGASKELLRWNKVDGKVVRGLSNRREDERQLFVS